MKCMMIDRIANSRRRWIKIPAVLKTRKLAIQTINRITAKARNIAGAFFLVTRSCYTSTT
jgi:hypothetical protein